MVINNRKTVEMDAEPIIIANIDSSTNQIHYLNLNVNNLYHIISQNEKNTIIQEEYLDIIKTNKLEIFGVDIVFSNEKWDFSSLKNDFNKENCLIYNFKINKNKSLTNSYETILKLLILDTILKDGAIRPYISKMNRINIVFLNYLMENKIYSLDDCKVYHIKKFLALERALLKETTITKYQTYILRLFNFYSLIMNKEIDHKIYNELTKRNKDLLEAEKKTSLIKLLPSKFMNKLTSNLYNDIMSTDLNHASSKELIDCRKKALIFIATQTGLRPEELLIIPYECIKTMQYGDLEVKTLNYYITKTVYGNGAELNETIANEKVVNVIDFIKKFYNGKYLGDDITYRKLRDSLKQYCINNCKYLENITKKPDEKFMGKPIEIVIENEINYINLPNMKQFRVYFDSELKKRGFNVFARAKLLGHHDEKMLDYYGRDVTTLEEDVNCSKILIKDFTNDENFKILGPKGNIYTNRIKKFLKKNQIKGISDIDELSNKLMIEMPIRAKLGGCCIKPYSNAECNKNDNTDEFLCSYGLCENQCHFFYNCLYYYDQFQELQTSYIHNKKHGYKKFAEKELYKIQHLLSDKLIPEIEELKNMIEDKGIEKVKKDYPQVEKIVDNIDKIEGEINKWKNEKMKK